MAKISVSLKDRKATRKEDTILVIAFSQFNGDDLSGENRQGIIIYKLESMVKSQNIKIMEQCRIIEAKEREIVLLRKGNSNCTKLKVKKTSLPYANCKLATSSLNLNNVNQKLKAGAEMISHWNALLNNKLNSIRLINK